VTVTAPLVALVADAIAPKATRVGLYAGSREVTDGAYPRAAATWERVTDGLANAAPVEFQATDRTLGELTAFGVFDRTGRLLVREPLEEPVYVPADAIPTFDAGDLTIAISS
jgi:hypothetical protein